MKTNMMPFYKSVLVAWSKWRKESLTSENILTQNIFVNDNFRTPNGDGLFYPELINKGIYKINHLIDIEFKIMNQSQMRTKYSTLTATDIFKIGSVIRVIAPVFYTFFNPITSVNEEYNKFILV